jgi:DNA-binding transcriptional LysR family regulator
LVFVFHGISSFLIPFTNLAKRETMQWADRIGRRIKLRDLHVLHAVAQAGSMTKAAGDLAISVPVVSKAIAELEHTIGVPLFDRSPKGVEPTAYGRALLRRGLVAFDELRQGVREIEFLANPMVGEVRVASTGPLAASFVAGIIDRHSRRYPRVVFHPTVGDAETLRHALAERNVDLVVGRRFGALADEELDFERLYDNPYAVMAGVKSPWIRRKKVGLADLMHEPWVLPSPDSAVGSFLGEAFRAQGLDFPRVAVVAFAYEVRVSLLATNRYLTILPESALRFPATHPLIKMVPVELSLRPMPIGISTLKNRTLSPVAQRFIDSAREMAKPLAKEKW